MLNLEDRGAAALILLKRKAEEKNIPMHIVEDFCLRYSQFEFEYKPLGLRNEDRRWEVVSGIQKAIRRGEVMVACRLASSLAYHSKTEVYSHLWKRLVVIAMEDVGLAEAHGLMVMTFLCHDVFCKKGGMGVGADLAMFVVHELATAPVKDRSVCDMAVIDYVYKESSHKAELDDLYGGKGSYLERIKCAPRYETKDPVHAYLASDRYKTMDMSLVYLATLDNAGDAESWMYDDYKKEIPVVETIKGIPSYAYDMHTRTGKHALRLFLTKEPIKEFFATIKGANQLSALSWCVFYVEAAVLHSYLTYPNRRSLSETAENIAMSWLGMPLDRVEELKQLVINNTYLLNRCRVYATNKEYPQ